MEHYANKKNTVFVNWLIVLFLFQFSKLITIQKHLGKDAFPLIEQAYYPNHKEMVSNMWVRFTSSLFHKQWSMHLSEKHWGLGNLNTIILGFFHKYNKIFFSGYWYLT